MTPFEPTETLRRRDPALEHPRGRLCTLLRQARSGPSRWAGVSVAVGLALTVAASTGAQEILQSVPLELEALEMHVIVGAAAPDDQVQCWLRSAGAGLRVAASVPIARGLTTGRITVLSLPLPLLDPGEQDYAIALVRGRMLLHVTPWRPLSFPGARPTAASARQPSAD